MLEFVQQTVNGIGMGGAYVMFASGFTLIFGVMNVINIAHGEFYMLGGLLTYFLMTSLGLNYFAAVGVCLLAAAGIGFVCNRVAVVPALGRPDAELIILIATIGLSIIMSNSALFVWGASQKFIASPFLRAYLTIGGVTINWQRVLLIVIAAISVTLLTLFLRFTKTGRIVRAAAQNKVGAALMGINLRQAYGLTFAIAAVMAALAGALAMPNSWATPFVGGDVLLKGFVVVILAGLGNIPGTIAAGLLLGIVEAYFGAFVSYAYKDAFIYLVIILLLLVRPQGLFARTGR